MEIGLLDANGVADATLDSFGVVPPADLGSWEGLAAAVRRAASFTCPTTQSALKNVVAAALRGLPGFDEASGTKLSEIISSLIGYGDLIELPVEDAGRRRRQLFLGPPAFVDRGAHSALILGIRPENVPIVGMDRLEYVEYRGYARLFHAPDDAPARDYLLEEGLLELRSEQWMRSPRLIDAADVVAENDARVAAVRAFPFADGIKVLDSSRRVDYYVKRWRPLTGDDVGHFIARRPQAYANDIWSYLEIENGTMKLVDLPLAEPPATGADEALRLQAAVDAFRGNPQRYRIRPGSSDGLLLLDFFSPLPMWAQRRLDALGRRVDKGSSALMTYSLPSNEVTPEVNFLATHLWMMEWREREVGE